MEIIKTFDFERSLKKLPSNIKRLHKIQEERFILNPNDLRLHIKKLRDLGGVFSFRITRKYRALFYFQNPNTAILFDVDHRKDVYR